MHGEIDNPKDHISIKIAKILLGLSYLFLFWQLVELYRSDLNFDNSIPLVLSCICMLTSTLLSVLTHIKPFAVYSPVAGYVIAVLVMENVNINTGTYIDEEIKFKKQGALNIMINMKTNIAWCIDINNTGIEWHRLQHKIGKIIEETIFIHTLSTGEMRSEFSIEIDNKVIDVYLKWDTFNKKIIIGCILA